jgi:hypothetical protein
MFVAVLACGMPAQAAFVNNVETFNGTTFDLNTWEVYSSAGSFPSLPPSLSQNDQLNLYTATAPLGASAASYTTIVPKVGIGQGVKADVTIHSPGSNDVTDLVELMLTSDSAGPSTNRGLDDHYVAVGYHTFGSDGFVDAFEGGSGSGVGYSILDSVLVIDHTYTFQITRDSSSNATLSLYDGNTQLGQPYTYTDLSGFPNGMHISLYSQYTDVSFDNVQITPEPASLGVVAVGTVLCLLRRRRSQRPENAA